jgi:integrase/recombinase XerD
VSYKWAEPDLNRRPSPRKAPNTDINAIIEAFKEFLIVDLQRAKGTVYQRKCDIQRFLKRINKPLNQITKQDIRHFLLTYKDYSPATRSNIIKAFKLFFRDFLEKPQLVASFKFPSQPFRPKIIPSKHHLQKFFHALSTPKDRALFLLYATTGLRRNEVLSLTISDIDFNNKRVLPKKHSNRTKHTWLSFFNNETKDALKQYLATRNDSNPKLFPMARAKIRKIWENARTQTQLTITPQVLRVWFACEMARLKVADRYVDAFCGRTPRSVLARNYTDYSPEKLKEIYDNARLTVLH